MSNALRSALATLPSRLALFEKGARAFSDVFGVDEHAELQRLEFERVVDREMRAVVDDAFTGGDRERRLRGDRRGDALRLVHEIRGRVRPLEPSRSAALLSRR